MKNSLLTAVFLLATDSCSFTSCESSFCRQLPDWDNELVCYKELSEDLTCTWLPVSNAPNTVNYTVYLKWNKIRKLFQRNTSSPYITIERKNLYLERFAYIWIAVNYAHSSCVKGKNISVLLSKAGKCLAPSNINAHQITNQMIIKWDLPTTPTPYELRYREMLTESTQWTTFGEKDIVGYKISSSYVFEHAIWCSNRAVPRTEGNKYLPGQIHVKRQGTNAVVTWTPEYNPKCFVVDWGTGKGDMHMKIITTATGNFMLVPRAGPTNVTILNITKHSAFVKWNEIAVEDRLGFLRGYRISYTDSSRKKSLAVTLNSSTTSYHLTGLKEKNIYRVQISGFTDAGEGPLTLSQPFSTPKYDKGFEGFVTGLFFSMIFILVFAPLTCSLVLQRTELNLALANLIPQANLLFQAVWGGKANWKPVSRPPLQALSDNDTTSLFVIEHESKGPVKLGLFTDGGEDSTCDTCQSDKPSNNIDISLRHEEISAEAVTSKEGIISFTAPLLSDYTSMEISQKALMSLTLKLSETAAHPHVEMELSSKPPQTVHKVLFAPQDYLKQSQVVLLPSGPAFTAQVNLN
ncbi:leukemia inhibitory factor receptor-like protein [Pitangus sulphuratus]|nr:leukemia inhibitory factor receptor-like protein [Pitangus sulphuratus]